MPIFTFKAIIGRIRYQSDNIVHPKKKTIQWKKKQLMSSDSPTKETPVNLGYFHNMFLYVS